MICVILSDAMSFLASIIQRVKPPLPPRFRLSTQVMSLSEICALSREQPLSDMITFTLPQSVEDALSSIEDFRLDIFLYTKSSRLYVHIPSAILTSFIIDKSEL